MRGAVVRLTALRFLSQEEPYALRFLSPGQPYALRRYASCIRKPNGLSRGAAVKTTRATLDALEAESERQLIELIRRRLALPLEKRRNFLRKRLPGGGSCL